MLIKNKTKETSMNILIIFLVLFCVVLFFIARPVRVDGTSMENTLHDSDIVLICMLPHEYQKGEIIVAKSPLYNSENIIKRIIAIENDVLQIKNNNIYVNDKKIEGTYIKEEWFANDLEITIPKGEIFLLGDNRNNSSDSRMFGTISISDIIGYVIK